MILRCTITLVGRAPARQGLTHELVLAFVGLLAIVGVLGDAAFFFGGFYNVAGLAEEPDFIEQALAGVRRASIKRATRS